MRKVLPSEKLPDIFKTDFELIIDSLCSGEYNMNFDYNRAVECSESKALPMLRFYGWKPYAVSLGANQSENEIDKELCRKYGYDIVRRPTGGRAVLHSNEITYSVVLNLNDLLEVHNLYHKIHLFLIEIFEKIGCKDLTFNKTSTDLRNYYKKSSDSVSCFASSARYEIMHQGKKVVGSAQRVLKNTLIQHGSILLDEGYENIADVIAVKSFEERQKFKEYILAHTSTLSKSAGRKITFEEVQKAVIEYFLK